MRRLIVTQAMLIVMLVPALAASQTAPALPLDGTTWSVRVTPDEAATKKGDAPFDDILVFNNGHVAMSECLKYGFKASKYSAEKTQDGWTVSTEQVSEKAGKSVWDMAISGDVLKGTLVSTKLDGTVLKYAVEGKKAGK